MSKGNVLVTGGSGYIGSHTVVELLKEDYSGMVHFLEFILNFFLIKPFIFSVSER